MFIHFSLRLLAGLSVGMLAAGAGMFLAWFIYLFAVPRSTAALLSLLIVGAGIGAGIGVVVAWLRLRHNRRRTTLATAIMTTIAGSLGSYGGYGFLISSGELFVETDRLAVIGRPDLNPTVILLIGATVAANVAMLGVAISSQFRRHGPR
jgi:ABC-type enterobactin transport system permease subunit